jgi:omega-6 fatty acid desaturase (delta-12 desaturase)
MEWQSLWFRAPRPFADSRDFFVRWAGRNCVREGTGGDQEAKQPRDDARQRQDAVEERPRAAFNTAQQRLAAAVVKAERERDKAKDTTEYVAEKLAFQANTGRLHARRLEKEAADSHAARMRLDPDAHERPTMDIISSTGHNLRPAVIDAHRWTQILGRYRKPNHARSIAELAITALPLVALWTAAWFAFSLGHSWASFLIAVPAAGFLVRLFMIQHDCGHSAFFSYRWANDWVGRVIGVLTLTPYDFWRRTHAIHHATSGNLDRRGIGDVDTLTVCEYRARSRWGRLKYRLYRHPLVMFGIGPVYQFFLKQRLPIGLMRGGWQPWVSTMATNIAIALIAATLVWLIGIKAFLVVHLPIMLLAATAGMWLFYVQHQFERTTWERDGEWNLHDAALHGSSYYDLPAFLRWFTANIGMHHVHHLCSRIPYYRLPCVLRDHPELRDVGRLTLLESFCCIHLVLWDETQHRLVSFHDARASG